MSYNAWMPLQNQGTDGKTYQYSAKKNERTSRGGTNTATDRKKEQDSLWDLSRESYVPSNEAEQYQVKKTEASKTGAAKQTKLSKKAQELLKQLKEKYSNMDFFVESYSTETEAQRYLSRGTKEYSVLIDPETLEAMAVDEDVRKQYEDILAGAGNRLEELKEKLGKDADQVKSFGISIDKEGKVSYFAELDKITESRNQQLERTKEKKAEAKKEAKRKEAKAEEAARRERKTESKFVSADSIDELVKKIREAASGKAGWHESFDLTM